MRASCCFKEPSCMKVEICNLYPPGKTDAALSGKMTATSWFCQVFVTLLIWAEYTTVDGLVDEKLEVPPTTTIGYHSTDEMMSAYATIGQSIKPSACGDKSHRCNDLCALCYEYFGGLTMDCLSQMLPHLCLSNYESSMESLSSSDWCTWSNVSSSYSNLSLCTEEVSDCLLIPWPNPLVERIFVEIHSRFFKDCPTEELSDPPPVIVFALVITPICLIPVMVSLVVLKTKNGDGST